ncbi:MAG TPA: DUF58 domain-containing protein [Methylomirabilota bacterium]|nr:DUF58 domain-containing protein [Methylomirabilota bacterium]
MTWRPTALNVSCLTLVVWALFLGVVAGRADLILVAVPLVVALVAGRRTGAPPAWQLTREVSTDRVFEDERVTVTATLRAEGPLPLVELLEPLPPRVHLERGRHHAFFTLRPGEEVRWTFALRCAGRQHLRLGGPHVRLWGPLGLTAAETRVRAPHTVAVYPHVATIRHLPRPVRTQTSIGNYVSPTRGEGIEPGDIRPFAPGDQVRHVNWRATLRLGLLHVTQHHRERNADVVLLLDSLADVGAEGVTVLDAAARGAAALAAAYLARKDRVGLIEYGGQLRWVKPGSGRAQLQRLLDTLLDASVVFTYVNRDLDLVPPRILPPQALVLALSPMLDPRFVRAASDLAARGFDLTVIAVSPVAATRAIAPPSPVADVAARLWALERRAQVAELRRRGLSIVEWDGVEPLDAALAALRRPRLRRVVAG